jgi:hypothetical protein
MSQLRTDIFFQVDSSTLKPGGDITNPVPLVHPQMYLKQSATAPVTQDGDYPVVVGLQEDVYIYVMDAKSDPSVRMAPCGFIAHDFGGKSLTDDDMTDAARQPITQPNFSETVDHVPFLGLTGANSGWGKVPSNYDNWAGFPLISQGMTKSIAKIYAPFVHFNVTSDSDIKGKLQYGIIFVVTRFDAQKNQTQEYFYFDPYLVINGDVGKRADLAVRAKMGQSSRK